MFDFVDNAVPPVLRPVVNEVQLTLSVGLLVVGLGMICLNFDSILQHVKSKFKNPLQLFTAVWQAALRKDSRTVDMYREMLAQKASIPAAKAEQLYINLITYAMNTNKPKFANELLQDMHKHKVRRSQKFYSSLCKLYSYRHQHTRLLELFDEMTSDGLTPDASMYTSLIIASAELNDSTKCVGFFEKLSKLEVPSIKLYMTLLRMFSQRRDYESSLALMKDMCQRGVEPDSIAFNSVLSTCVNAGKMDVAQQLIDDVKDMGGIVDVISFNTLIKGYALKGNFEGALKALRALEQHNLQPDDISFNTVMDSAVRSKNAESAWELLDEMETRGLHPDKYTCSILIKGLPHAPKRPYVLKAISLIQQVGPEGANKLGDDGKLHEVLFNTILDACVETRDLKLMEQVFKHMQRLSVVPSSVTYGTLIKAFGQAHRLEQCFDVWKDMNAASVKPTAVTFGCLIEACMANGQTDRAMEVFANMKNSNYAPNTVVYTSMIHGFAKAKQVDKAMQIYRSMQDERIPLNAVTFNSLLDACARASDTRLNSVLEDMRRQNVPPTVVTYSILIKASCDSGDLPKALALFESMRNKGFRADEIVFNSLLSGCLKEENVKLAGELFELMLSINVRPGAVTLSILVQLYGKCNMLDEAFELIERMKKRPTSRASAPIVNVQVCTRLIQACARNKKLRRGLNVFEQMLDDGLMPDGFCYGALIQGCIYVYDFDLAAQLVKGAYGLQKKYSVKRKVNLPAEVLNALLAAVKKKGCKVDPALYDLISEEARNANYMHPNKRTRQVQRV